MLFRSVPPVGFPSLLAAIRLMPPTMEAVDSTTDPLHTMLVDEAAHLNGLSTDQIALAIGQLLLRHGSDALDAPVADAYDE